MPVSVAISAGIGAIVGTTSAGVVFGGLSAVLSTSLLYGGLAAASYLANRIFAPDAPSISGGEGTTSVTTSENTPARWVVGYVRVGGWLCWMREGRESNQDGYRHLQFVIALSEAESAAGAQRRVHELVSLWIDGLREPWIKANQATRDYDNGVRATPYTDQHNAPPNAIRVPRRSDDPVGPDNWQAYSTYVGEHGDKYIDVYTIWPYLTGDGEHSDLDLEGMEAAESGSDYDTWGPRHRADGIAYVVVDLYQPKGSSDPEEAAWRSIPALEFLVKGISIRYPVAVSTDAQGNETVTYRTDFSQNAADVIYWFLVERCATPVQAIDAASFVAARAVCAQELKGEKGTYKRYTINGVISADADNGQVIEEMMIACAGSLIEYDGKIRLLVGVDRPSVRTITDDDIIETLTMQPSPSYTDRLNALRMTLAQSSRDEYLELDIPEVVDEAALVRDKNILLPQNWGTLAFVDDPHRATALAYIALRRARAASVFTLQVRGGDNFENLELLPGDVVTVENSLAFVEGRRMEVLENRIQEDWSCILVLQHAPLGLYDMTPKLAPDIPSLVHLPPAGEPVRPALFNWRGDWALGNFYTKNDIVRYQKQPYVCLQSHTATNDNKPTGTNESNDWWASYGVDAHDGVGREDIWGRTAHTALSIAAPNNSWGYDSPVAPWYDGIPDPLSGGARSKVWHAWRKTEGAPEVGDAVEADWSTPSLVFEDPEEGHDGFGVENIYASVPNNTVLRANQKPLNSWPYDPVTPHAARNGISWVDDPPARRVGYKTYWSSRKIIGTPDRGTAKQDGWGNWSEPRQIEGRDGDPGEDGNGYEDIYTRTNTGTFNNTHLPLDTWAFDSPNPRRRISDGWAWWDEPLTLGPGQYLWKCTRRVPGTPNVGDTPPSSGPWPRKGWGQWSTPALQASIPKKLFGNNYAVVAGIQICNGAQYFPISASSHTSSTAADRYVTVTFPRAFKAGTPVTVLVMYANLSGLHADAEFRTRNVGATSFQGGIHNPPGGGGSRWVSWMAVGEPS